MEEINLDSKMDFYDRAHVNINGQIKLTQYLGKYLLENFPNKITIHDEDNRFYSQYQERYNSLADEYKENLENKAN